MSAEPGSIRILAVDDHALLREGIAGLVAGQPEMNGVDAMIAIRGEFPEARIIVLTTYTGDVQVLRALKAGARAYLLKNLLHKELLETIRAVHAGKRTVSPEVSFQL